MTARYRTVDGDVLDAICWRHYGHERATAAVLEANPGLAARGPVLPAGVVIELPDLQPPTTAVIRLWG